MREPVLITRAMCDVLDELAADGAENPEIAARLGIDSIDTVKSRVTLLLKRTGCKTRTELAVKTIRRQIRYTVVDYLPKIKKEKQ